LTEVLGLAVAAATSQLLRALIYNCFFISLTRRHKRTPIHETHTHTHDHTTQLRHRHNTITT